MVGVRERDMTCVMWCWWEVTLQLMHTRIRVTTEVYFAYVVLFGTLGTNRRCVLADALLVELKPLRESFFEILLLCPSDSRKIQRFDGNTNPISCYRNTSPSLQALSSG